MSTEPFVYVSVPRLLKRMGFTLAKAEQIFSQIDKYYYHKRIVSYNVDGSIKKCRDIYPSQFDLKALQSGLNQQIFAKIAHPSAVTGGIPRLSNILNAKHHLYTKNRFVTDIRDFFPSIDFHQVYHALIQRGFVPTMARFLTRATTYHRTIPQGAPTSSYIANIVFRSADLEISKYCETNGFTYTRFIDDITISSTGDLSPHVYSILKIISDHGFRINDKKTHLKIGKTTITGIDTGERTLRPTPEQIRRSKSPTLSDQQRAGFASYFSNIYAATPD